MILEFIWESCTIRNALGADESVLGTVDGYCGFPANKLGNAFSSSVLSGVYFSSENGIGSFDQPVG